MCELTEEDRAITVRAVPTCLRLLAPGKLYEQEIHIPVFR